ncbi:MAG: molybdopterin-guanine dinucleotide biosynthesis protein B [Candidatus Bathyarchaeia archaeon]
MIVIAVVGRSGSGKTTTIEYLTSQLSKEGYKVGSIKHIHHSDFSIDTEGTDTWRHMHAGATVTVALAPRETVIIKKTDAPLGDFNQIIGLLDKEKLDLIFIEGLHSLCAKRKDVLKIITARDQEELAETLNGTDQPILAITGAVVKEKIKLSGIRTPIIDLNSEGESLIKLIKSHFDSKKKNN